MSKAFLRESDETNEPPLAAPVSPLPPGARNYVTAAGAKRMRDELRRLRTIERPSLRAKADIDPQSKLRLAALDERIRYLENSLLTAEVVERQAGPTDVVRFGATVIVREPDGTLVQYRLIGVDETDPARGAISWVSPLARAMMNMRTGARVEVATPTGPKELTIIAVRYDSDG